MKSTLKEIIGMEYDDPGGNIRILTPKDAELNADTPVMTLLVDQPVPEGWTHQMDSRDIRDWLRSWEDLPRDRAIDEVVSYIVDLEASAKERDNNRRMASNQK